MKHCYLFRDQGIHPHSTIILRRTAAIGDALAATVVAQALSELGYSVIFQTHPDIGGLIPFAKGVARVSRPEGVPNVNLDGVYENHPARRSMRFDQLFMEAAAHQLRGRRGVALGPALNCKPRLFLPSHLTTPARSALANHPHPWVFICPRSNTYAVRTIEDHLWAEAARHMPGTKFWLGNHAPAPAGIVDLQSRSIINTAAYLAHADLLVTVDTGPMHIAAALNIPIVAIGQSSSPECHLNDQNDFITISPPLDCLNCQLNVCPKGKRIPPCTEIDPHWLAEEVRKKCAQKTDETVSAIVAIYKPEVATLNRCLAHLWPQVDEIIVTAEGNSVVPPGARVDNKIRYVRTRERGIGYGRNTNFGARHSHGKYLLLINDDVFLDPDAVSRLRECLTPDVGMVSHLLRYPDGTIYHAGKTRSLGVAGWGHIDHRHHIPSIKEVTEMENVCGASVLVRRELFYQMDGFDETFFLFAEDDDFSLRVRRAGYRILYTPHASGIHMEHQSVGKVGDIMSIVHHANSRFGEKWGWYLEKNKNRVPGTFD